MSKKGIENLAESYAMGIKRFHDFLQWCSERGVNEVTIYALSLENIQNRSRQEVSTLIDVFNKHALKALNDERIHKNKVKVNLCGNLEQFDNLKNQKVSDMMENLNELVEKTSGYDNLILNLAIGYGGRQEILNAAEKIALSDEEFTEENMKKHLWVKDYPDLIIRTSESRLSNFLPWQSAYSEIYFIDCLWQEFTQRHLDEVLDDYEDRDRRFGR